MMTCNSQGNMWTQWERYGGVEVDWDEAVTPIKHLPYSLHFTLYAGEDECVEDMSVIDAHIVNEWLEEQGAM